MPKDWRPDQRFAAIGAEILREENDRHKERIAHLESEDETNDRDSKIEVKFDRVYSGEWVPKYAAVDKFDWRASRSDIDLIRTAIEDEQRELEILYLLSRRSRWSNPTPTTIKTLKISIFRSQTDRNRFLFNVSQIRNILGLQDFDNFSMRNFRTSPRRTGRTTRDVIETMVVCDLKEVQDLYIVSSNSNHSLEIAREIRSVISKTRMSYPVRIEIFNFGPLNIQNAAKSTALYVDHSLLDEYRYR